MAKLKSLSFWYGLLLMVLTVSFTACVDDNDDTEAPYLEVKVLLEEPEPMLRQEIEEALAGKKYRLARIVSAYRQEERVEKEADGWKKGLQEMSPLQISQSAFEKVYQTEMPADLTDLFQEAYISATRKEEEEGE